MQRKQAKYDLNDSITYVSKESKYMDKENGWKSNHPGSIIRHKTGAQG